MTRLWLSTTNSILPTSSNSWTTVLRIDVSIGACITVHVCRDLYIGTIDARVGMHNDLSPLNLIAARMTVKVGLTSLMTETAQIMMQIPAFF